LVSGSAGALLFGQSQSEVIFASKPIIQAGRLLARDGSSPEFGGDRLSLEGN
jgi:hypothetical protein